VVEVVWESTSTTWVGTARVEELNLGRVERITAG